MKVALVYPNQNLLPVEFDKVTNIPKEPVLLPPLGLVYIASNLKKHKANVIDNRLVKNDDYRLTKFLSQFKAVGFGGTIFEDRQAITVSKKLRQKGIYTFYGGSNATVNPELYQDYFDLIVRGEAELELDKILDKKPKGIHTCKRIKDLDKLKFPDRNNLMLLMYRRREPNYLGDISPVDTVVSSRGCPFDCTFCSSKEIWGQRATFRSVDNVIDEIKFLMKTYKTKGIYFREDNFTTKKKRLVEFCKKIKKYKIKWLCESRVDTLDEKTIKKMSESGCGGIWFGIESTSNKTLKLIDKNITIEQAKETIELCNKYGIKTGGGFMVGFPHETAFDILQTFSESKKLGLDRVFYNRVWAIPKSKLYSEIIKKKLDTYNYNNIILPATEHLTADEVTTLFHNKTYNWKSEFIKRFLSKEQINSIATNHPTVAKVVRKIL